MIIVLMVFLMCLPFFFAMMDGRAAIMTRRKNKAEIQNSEPKYDESGFLVEYDPHHVRALEIELDTHPDLLTNCDNKDCDVCKTGYTKHADDTVKDELVDNAVAAAKGVETQADSLVELAIEDAEEMQRQIEEQERMNKVHPVEEFRPDVVPADAIPTVTEDKGRVTIEWLYIDHNSRAEKYLVRLTGYRVVDGDIRLTPLWRASQKELDELNTELKVHEKCNEYGLNWKWVYDDDWSTTYSTVYTMQIQDSYGDWYNLSLRKFQ